MTRQYLAQPPPASAVASINAAASGTNQSITIDATRAGAALA